MCHINTGGTLKRDSATTVRFEGSLANPRLLEVLSKRFNVVSKGADEFFEIIVK